jgi:hypothetical protein
MKGDGGRWPSHVSAHTCCPNDHGSRPHAATRILQPDHGVDGDRVGNHDSRTVSADINGLGRHRAIVALDHLD